MSQHRGPKMSSALRVCSIAESCICVFCFAEGTAEREPEEVEGKIIKLDQVRLGHSGGCWVASAGP